MVWPPTKLNSVQEEDALKATAALTGREGLRALFSEWFKTYLTPTYTLFYTAGFVQEAPTRKYKHLKSDKCLKRA